VSTNDTSLHATHCVAHGLQRRKNANGPIAIVVNWLMWILLQPRFYIVDCCRAQQNIVKDFINALRIRRPSIDNIVSLLERIDRPARL